MTHAEAREAWHLASYAATLRRPGESGLGATVARLILDGQIPAWIDALCVAVAGCPAIMILGCARALDALDRFYPYR